MKPKSYLAPEALELVSVHLHFLEESSILQMRSADSAFHRSTGYVCHPFHKPISKCIRSKSDRGQVS
jgi:hypothetical protein